MRVITWNCNLKFKEKFELVNSYDPDICFIQECEKLKFDFFPNFKYFWTGRNENKGLGVLTKKNDFFIDESHNKNLINFLPIKADNLKLLSVWSYNHRARKFGAEVSGNTIDAINFYKDWFGDKNEKCIIAGDFNNSIIWDKKGNDNNFDNINNHLMSLGFASNYHKLKGEIFGKESSPTFFHTKKEHKKYHIDYIYSKNLNPLELKIGPYSEWITFSDHSPLIMDLD
tara:strand:- start:2478 stop:3161 length:684 start_codon:yes stop_codon:yes gene_type:complete